MSGTSLTTALVTGQQAMHAAALAAVTGSFDGDTTTATNRDQVLVCYGFPMFPPPANYVSIRESQIDQAVAVLSTNRGREETVLIHVEVGCARQGDHRQQIVALTAAATILGQLERYVRGGAGFGDTTMGGVVRECFLITAVTESLPMIEEIADGRQTVINATFSAKVRVTG